jgi:regulator of protease activity HflC (stomatin/prohibitin superfamily)
MPWRRRSNATSFGKNPEFYDFYRSLTAYRNVFQQGNDTLVLKPDSEFFRYFGTQRANDPEAAWDMICGWRWRWCW